MRGIRRFPRYLWFALVVGILVGGVVAFASDPQKSAPVAVGKGEVRVVTVDHEGNRHQKVYVIEGADEKRAWLGVRLREGGSGEQGGAVVDEVIDDSPAQRGGVRIGDVIVQLDGKEIDSPEKLVEVVREFEPGSRVELQILRDGNRRSATVELGARGGLRIDLGDAEDVQVVPFDGDVEAQEDVLRDAERHLHDLQINIPGPGKIRVLGLGHRPRLGVQLVEATPELREHLGGDPDAGVLVGKVLPDTAAQRAGIRVGDLIVSADGKPIASAADLVDALEEAAGRTIPIDVIRDRTGQTLDTTIPADDHEREGDRPRAATGDDDSPEASEWDREMRSVALKVAQAARLEAERAARDAETVSRERQRLAREASREVREASRRAAEELRKAMEEAREEARKAAERVRLSAARWI